MTKWSNGVGFENKSVIWYLVRNGTRNMAPLKHHLSFLKQYVKHGGTFLLHCMHIHIMLIHAIIYKRELLCFWLIWLNNSPYAWVRRCWKNMNGYWGCKLWWWLHINSLSTNIQNEHRLYGLVMIIINCHCNYMWCGWISRPAASNSQMRLFRI